MQIPHQKRSSQAVDKKQNKNNKNKHSEENQRKMATRSERGQS